MYPQLLGSLVPGSNFHIAKMLVPRQSALYFRNMPNIPQPASLIDWVGLWFFIILLTAKSSTHTLSYRLVIASVTLCIKSFGWLVIFSGNVANRLTDFFLLLPPVTFPETLRCKSLCWEIQKNRVNLPGLIMQIKRVCYWCNLITPILTVLPATTFRLLMVESAYPLEDEIFKL
jgi:hypothetical protein